MTPTIESRLPDIGTTIFSVMSALANEHGAINLGQGFPNFGCDPLLLKEVDKAMQAGHLQYPPMPGLDMLRAAISSKIRKLYGHLYDMGEEVTVTAGATQALSTALMAVIQAGDEVIVIEPAYDSYLPAIRLAGGTPVCVAMALSENGFSIDWDRIRAAITSRTRVLMINSPHNPTGSVLTDNDLDKLSDLMRDTNIIIISDEVYEHMVFDGGNHLSMSSRPELAERSLVVSSFGKTYHVTGWKVGYVVGPKPLMKEFRKLHQYQVFTVNTTMQAALAQYMAHEEPYLGLSSFYQRKRDVFRQGFRGTEFELLACAGTYFQSVRHRRIAELGELGFCQWLTREIGVAAIPVSSFFHDGRDTGVVRFCFAKTDDMLLEAIQRLTRF